MATTLDVTVNNNQALRALDQISTKLAKLGQEFEGAFSRARTSAAALTGSLLAVGAATAAFADDISDVAAANNLTIGTVLGLSKALEAAGGKGDSVGRMFQTLSNNIEGANQGNVKSITSFQRLGLSMQDLGSMAANEINGQVIKSLAAMQNVTERNALAMEIFGKAALGVDWARLASGIDENVDKYEQFAPALDTAGAAFDNIKSVLGDIKVAFAVAFEPIFRYIADLKVAIPDLVKGFNLLAAALGVITGAAVLGGMIKLVELFKVLTTVVSKNPLVAIASALLSVGTGVAAYLGLTREQEAAQARVTEEVKKTADVTKKTTNDQSGYNDMLAKGLDSITKIGAQLQVNFKSARDRYDLDIRGLSLSEQQKKIAQDTGDIEKQTQQALLQLESARAAQNAIVQAATKDAYDRERTAIIANGESQKKYATERITQLQQTQAALKDLLAATELYGSVGAKILENETRAQIPLLGSINERITLEAKLNQVQQIRAALIAQTSKLSETERAAAINQIDEAISRLDIQRTSYDAILLNLQEQFKALQGVGYLSKENADTILKGSEAQVGAIKATNKELGQSNIALAEQARTFSYGWTTAMNEYVLSAQNGAQQATQAFQTFSRGFEDAIVGTLKGGKDSFKNFLSSILEMILRSQIQQLLASQFAGFSAVGGGGGGGSILGSVFKSLLGFANGGMIPTNGPVVVGERGPEILTGAGGRSVIPNDALGGGGGAVNVTYNINAVDAASFNALVARDPEFLFAVTEQGRRRLPQSRR
jgi:lambda family phage tail tape measure protein